MTKTRIAALIAAVALVLGALACGGTATPDAPEPQVPATASEKPVAAKKTKTVSPEQENAVATAEGYLRTQSFSRSGLIGQLVYEDYPKAVATRAVDSLDVDWNEQAARSAKSYLEDQHFSRKGLIGQLEYEGYTHAQATSGVSKAGL